MLNPSSVYGLSRRSSLLFYVQNESDCVQQSLFYPFNGHKWMHPKGSTWAGQRRKVWGMIDNVTLHAHTHSLDANTLMHH